MLVGSAWHAQVFLLTNSLYDYTEVVCKFLLGDDWLQVASEHHSATRGRLVGGGGRGRICHTIHHLHAINRASTKFQIAKAIESTQVCHHRIPPAVFRGTEARPYVSAMR